MLEVKTVTAGYGRKEILHGISACFERGNLTCIVGPNGCGKSTLLKATLGILQPTAGTVSLDGEDLSGMHKTAVAKRIAYLAQGKSVPDMTAGQLVLHGRFPHLHYPRRYTARDRSIAFSAMERMGIADHAGTPMSALSGGMRQKVWIAMALAQDTGYILLDEPNTYLDIAHQLDLMRLLRELAGDGKGIVAVMHDLPMALTFSDRITVMREGGIIMSGSPKEICGSGVLTELFGVSVCQDSETGDYFYRY